MVLSEKGVKQSCLSTWEAWKSNDSGMKKSCLRPWEAWKSNDSERERCTKVVPEYLGGLEK